MAFEQLPDEEIEYVPSDEDFVGDVVDTEPSEEQSDATDSVGEPDGFPTDEEGVESEPGDLDGFEPSDGAIDAGLSELPAFAEDFPDYIPLEHDEATAEVDDDEGDVYSASTGAPTDEEWDAVEDGDASVPAPALFAALASSGDVTDDDVEALTGDDFALANVSDNEMVDPDVAAPVSYEIQGKAPGGEWQTLANVPASQVDAEIAGLPTEQAWLFRVRAQFSNGEVTDWSAETTVDLPRDMLAPPVPSTPEVVAKRGVFTIKWDGKGVGGTAQPADYKFTVVWVSSTGEAGTWNAIGTMNEAGELLWTGGEYFDDMFFSLSSLDNNGNSSARSGSAVAVMKPLVEEPDIQAELNRIDTETGGLITEAQQLGDRLDTAESELTSSKQRLSAAETELDNAFGLIGSADSKATSAQAKADEAKADAAAAAGIANGKGDVLIQSTTPVTAMRKATTLWIDTTGGANTPKRWNGTAWVEVTDKAAKDAASAAASADAKAQQAIKDAADAKAQAESAIRQAPTLFEWTADFNPGNKTTQTKTPSEISYDGNQAASQYAHRLTSKSVPISANRVYRMQAIVSNLGSSPARFQSGFYLNNASGGYVSSLWPSDSTSPVPVGASRMTVTSTPRVGDLAGGVEMASAAIYFLDSQPMILHDMKVVDVTDIISAQETADSALTMAGSKSTVFYDTKNPTGTANKGDVWRKVDASKNVIAEWFWSAAGAWESSQVTNELISNLDVGKLVAGSATINSAVVNKIAAQTASIQQADIKNLTVSNGTFSEAVIEKLWADVIHARKITADMVVISSGANLIVDPNFTDDALNKIRQDYANSTGATGWYWTGSYWYSKAGLTDGTHTFPLRSTAGGSIYSDLTIETGARYLMRWEGFISGTSATTRMAVRVKKRDGTTRFVGVGPTRNMASGWAFYTNEWTPEADDISFCPEVQFLSAVSVTRFAMRNPSITAMASGELIVDGAVVADKLAANAVTADKVAANAITADKISSGAVTAIKVAANAITADKISASAVTGTKIAANTITAGNIAANAITASELAAGAVKAENIAADAITGKTISGGTISGTEIVGGSVTMESGGYSVKMVKDQWGGAIGFTVPKSSTNGTIRSEVEADSGPTTGAAQLVLRSPASTDFPARGYIKINSWRGDGQELDQPSVTLYGDVHLPQHCTFAGSGRINLMGGGGAMLTVDNSVLSMSIYNRTYSSASNVYVTSNGVIGRATSALKYKEEVQVVDPSTYEDALLSIESKSWIDKTEANNYREYLEWEAQHPYQPIPREMLETPTAPPKRHYGAIADEFHDAGLSQFVTYDQNGEVEGLAYDRVGVALLPIVRKQRDKIADLEAKLEALMERVDRLEAA